MFKFLLWITSTGYFTVILFMSQKTTSIIIPANGDIQNFWFLAVKDDCALRYIISFHKGNGTSIIHHINHLSLLHSRPAGPDMCKGISASFHESTDLTLIMYAPC